MATNRFYFITMLALVLVLGYLTFQIIKPFLAPLAWAIVLTIVFYPLYLYLLRYIKWKSVASLVVLFVIILLILGPFSYTSYLLFNEIQALSASLGSEQLESAKGILHHPTIRSLLDRVSSALNISLSEAEVRKAFVSGISRVGKDLLGRLPGGVGNLASVVMDFVIMAFSIFFLLRDSADFLVKGRDYLPFSPEQKEKLSGQIKDIVISTIYGGVVVAIVQGIIGGIAYALLGVHSPALWGLTTAVASFVPLLGTFAVWGAITIYFLIMGMTGKAVILLLVGVLGISSVDNILRPVLVGARTRMHILVIFFSVLGGINLFGLIGFIIGPLVVALFVSMVEIFRNFEGGLHA
ncbi:MAG: AI-2E family transporter [Alphaproteobacteria bacterium]|uniref:AI-2E family transporter n=1 Tax=Candidatus Nitrobium versatile TaxID=2884831 RepID=A0A953M2J5_9BACT|nr:AI-2E family transporter [Candidatus Nitrobium versatile]